MFLFLFSERFFNFFKIIHRIDGVSGNMNHFKARDVSFVCVASAAPEKLEAFRQRMGWNDIRFLSCREFSLANAMAFDDLNDDNAEYNYKKKKDGARLMKDAPGVTCWSIKRNEDNSVAEIAKTYDCSSRGLDMLNVTYQYLDLVPKGRDEKGLPWSMAWLRRHDEY